MEKNTKIYIVNGNETKEKIFDNIDKIIEKIKKGTHCWYNTIDA